MQPALRSPIPDAPLAVFPVNGGKPHQGPAGENPAPNQEQSVCKSTVLLGMHGQAELNRIGSCCTGKERDAESDNDYFGARYYASTTGRFLSPDWSAKQEPVPYAKLDNPQTLNLYGYVLNNPLTKTDPDGHDLWDKIANWAHGNGFRDTPNPQQPAAPAPPTPQQVPGAGPTVVLPGQKYPSAQNAAVNTINNINPTSIKEDREYAARAVQNADGSFSVVGPNPGGQSGSQFPAVPDGTLDAAQIHTHGAADPGYDNENFSTRQTSGVNNDIDDARHDMVPSYLGTPSGTIKVYNPSTNTTTIIQQPTSNPQ